ncbi:MAG: 16S rRNA (cytosine(1402)-N(4))-methyltransferase [Candidatus Yanofskybacteria bacterium RIFCSPLOWO2_02_FULL_45_10]|uniref:Ribosomal RNA small subunit methyltransferase H n=2 Tax=Candidatus Yanofskyibacteriota TaxID=1752733 RepID=A0A1F8G6W5_9BACT|nr:MAG: 16S rRNA (cytosine(1402)-N(4))-methyltransferase [Candidatus Yanofskybacteria bacterium RIFCSPHIGHO2_12_FULL_45_19b]OGN31634.1 MAG: 16S rRNA (cytosine(1402)-N(4))-methyltransferase [Candidatus Yanofskybacteria bacterium RIFCSPLOWO2_02_FULL_45_10]
MHKPVLLNAVLQYLDPQPGQKFVDATVSHGGHGFALWCSVQPGGQVLGIEWDSELADKLVKRAEHLGLKEGITVVNDSYTNLKKIAEQYDFNQVDGILFDLGLSSWHLDESGRGFSFQKVEDLDMRFNRSTTLTAMEIINTWPERELVRIIKDYGEEGFAEKIARGIVEVRQQGAITTTDGLVAAIEQAVPHWYQQRRLNPATKTFQALRLAVNSELENIEHGLEAALKILNIDGRLAVISFHSLEDKIVKTKFKEWEKAGVVVLLNKHVVKPDFSEVNANPRARSAHLRIVKKVANERNASLSSSETN